MEKQRFRFAPSPTGYLHIGGLRTVLYNYFLAQQNDGQLILRIEDTDQSRKVQDSIQNLLKVLDLYGIDFDEGPHCNGDYGPYIQSQRLDIYKKYYIQMIEEGNAYPCFENMDDLVSKQLSPSEALDKMSSIDQYYIKMKIPDTGKLDYYDIIRGKISFDLSIIDDPIIIKSDGYPTYHFANVVDDSLMKISDVIRGEEWIPSVPKHILLYDYLGWEYPNFAHLPLILNADRSKLSKRQNDVSVESYMNQGYLIDAMINYISLLGWNDGTDNEIYNRSYLIKQFSLSKIHKSGAIFDTKKLDWMNKFYINQLPFKEFKNIAKHYLEPDYFQSCSEKTIDQLLQHAHSRIAKLNDLEDVLNPFINDSIHYDDNDNILKDDATTKVLNYWVKVLAEKNQYTADDIKNIFTSCSKLYGIKGKALYFPIRLALIGKYHGPEISDIINLLGVDNALVRLKKALNI